MQTDFNLLAVRAVTCAILLFGTAAQARADAIFVGLWNGSSGTIAQYTTSGAVVNANLITGLSAPAGIAASADRLYISNYYTGTIGSYALDGTPINPSLITGLSGPEEMVVSGNDLYVINFGSGSVGKYTTDGAVVNPSLISGLNGPTDLKMSDGDLFVTNYYSGTVGRYTTLGATVNAALISGLNGPQGLTVSGSDIYVANESTNTIGHYTTSGNTVNAALISSGLTNPSGVAVADNHLIALNYGPGVPVISGGSLGKYTMAGAAVNVPLFSGLNLPQSFLVDPNVLIPAAVAGPEDKAFFTGTRPLLGVPGPPTTISYESLEITDGSLYGLGSNETLNLNNGAGTVTIRAGGTFIGNGVVVGSMHNSGLVIVPITRAGLVNQTTGGVIRIQPDTPPAPNDPPILIDLDPRMDVAPETMVQFGGSGFASGGGGGGGGGATAGHYVVSGPGIENSGTIAWDGTLEVTGNYDQTETGVLRMFIAGDEQGETYSLLQVGQQVTLSGTLQVVLQPELFGYLPTPGDTFDMIIGADGISIVSPFALETLVTAAGAAQLEAMYGVSLSPYLSPFASDPNQLFMVNPRMFRYHLVENDTVLRVEFIGVPEPSSVVLLGLGVVGIVGHCGWKRRRSTLQAAAS